MLFDLPKCPLIFVIQSEGTSAFSGIAITLIRGGGVTSLTHLSSITHHFSHIAYNCITCIKNKHADFTSHVFFFFFSWSGCVLFSCQVVVKTKADYDGESKKGKLRSPKIAEFSISIIEGVSERLKVRITELLQSVFHASSISQYTPTHAHPWEQTCVCLLLRTFFIPPPIIIFPPQHSSYLLAPSFSPLSPPCPPLLPVILAGYTERHNAHWFT